MKMENINGLRFEPIFHSEISSSFLIFELFNNHKKMAQLFVNQFLNLGLKHNEITVVREKFYLGKGSVDIFLEFDLNGKETHVLIEVKVHDYISATKGQIVTYFNAATDEIDDIEIYFIYLTQFNAKNQPDRYKVSKPPTITEFEESQLRLRKTNLKHINWHELNVFINQHQDGFSEEENLMYSLQKLWMEAKSMTDIKENTLNIGDRGIEEYFTDISINIESELPFGELKATSKRLIYSINIIKCNPNQFAKIIEVVKTFSKSEEIDKTKTFKTVENTNAQAISFLQELAQDEDKWNLLSFYSSLFSLVKQNKFMMLNGSYEFSIKVNLLKTGMLSLCTLRRNKTIEFSLKR